MRLLDACIGEKVQATVLIRALHFIHALSLISCSALKRVSKSQGAKHTLNNPMGMLITCLITNTMTTWLTQKKSLKCIPLFHVYKSVFICIEQKTWRWRMKPETNLQRETNIVEQ